MKSIQILPNSDTIQIWHLHHFCNCYSHLISKSPTSFWGRSRNLVHSASAGVAQRYKCWQNRLGFIEVKLMWTDITSLPNYGSVAMWTEVRQRCALKMSVNHDHKERCGCAMRPVAAPVDNVLVWQYSPSQLLSAICSNKTVLVQAV